MIGGGNCPYYWNGFDKGQPECDCWQHAKCSAHVHSKLQVSQLSNWQCTWTSGIFYFKQVLFDICENTVSYLVFSVVTTMRLRKNSSLFFCMISSEVKPWLPFSTVFCAEDKVLPWSALTGSAAGAGEKIEISSQDWNYWHTSHFVTTASDSTYPLFWYFYSSCHPVPSLCPHPLSQSLTSQFFGISRTP